MEGNGGSLGLKHGSSTVKTADKRGKGLRGFQHNTRHLTFIIPNKGFLFQLIRTADTSVYLVARTPGYEGHLAAPVSGVQVNCGAAYRPRFESHRVRLSELKTLYGFVYLPPRKPRRLLRWE